MAQVGEREARAFYHPGEPIRVEPTDRWIRVKFNGRFVADSKRALLVHTDGQTPSYYFPKVDVRMELTEPSDKVASYPHKGKTVHRHLRVGDRRADNALLEHPEAPEEYPALRYAVTFKWNSVDAWFEEEAQIFVHPRDPYKRVDVLESSRHVRVEIGGVTVADSERPYLLFETGLPTRYYLPAADVRMDLLEPSDHQTACPYKGQASYYNVVLADEVYSNYVWYYPDPVPEQSKIEGLLCFYNEKVDLSVDGELQERPETPFS